MKPITIQDEEDDLAAEEENKIINEVRRKRTSMEDIFTSLYGSRSTRLGMYIQIIIAPSRSLKQPNVQEEERAILVRRRNHPRTRLA
jgi:hypothetical protein